jgi:hypothetical protein
VFALILAVLAFIPLVAHFVYTQSNTYFITHARPGSRPDEVGCTKKPWDFADNYTLEAQNGNCNWGHRSRSPGPVFFSGEWREFTRALCDCVKGVKLMIYK